MNRNGSEALVRQGSSVWRSTGAMFAALAMSVGVASAFAAAPAPMTLGIDGPASAIPGTAQTYTVTLTNASGNTLNNVGLTLSAPSATLLVAPTPTCVLSTGVTCTFTTDPTLTPTSFQVAGYQLPAKGTLTIIVGYYMPAAPTTTSFVIDSVGTASNNVKNVDPSAYTTLSARKETSYLPVPPANPNISVTFAHADSNALVWSPPVCTGGPNVPVGCGPSYYGQYTVMVKNDDTFPTTQAVNVVVGSNVTDVVVDPSDCSSPCSSPTRVTTALNKQAASVSISAGLAGKAITSFTVVFRTPQSPTTALDGTATTSIGSLVLGTFPFSTLLTDAAVGTYTSVLPASLGGSAKAKNVLPPNAISADPRPFNTRVDVPTFPAPITLSLTVSPGVGACSSSSPQCLDTVAKVQDNTGSITFPGTKLNGTDFLVITMIRDWTTLDKKPSSVFNATVWYTDDNLNRVVVKDCANVDLTVAERCVYQRIDTTTSFKGVLNGGELKFIIWARHNGVWSW